MRRAALSALLLAGCATARRGAPLAPPVEPRTAQQKQGELAFMHHCYRCHLNGEGGLGPPLNNKPLPSALIKLQVRHGFGQMPAFSSSELSDADLDAIVSYLDLLRG